MSAPFMPVTGYSTDQWQQGDAWTGIHPVYIPGNLDAGTYTVAIQLFDPSGKAAGTSVPIGQMAVTTPPRNFSIPRMGVTADTAWQNGINLLGYDLKSLRIKQGDGLNLTLYWQTDRNVHTSLTIFIHIYDESGKNVTQQDTIPLNGSRPTTGWASGEVLTDPHAIFIPLTTTPGRYWIRIGLYDAATGIRVPLSNGNEFWILPQTIRVTGE
jgi:hypothetical protein